MSMYRAIIGSAVAYVGQAASCDDTMLIQTETSIAPVRLAQEASGIIFNPEMSDAAQLRLAQEQMVDLGAAKLPVMKYLSATEPKIGATDMETIDTFKASFRAGQQQLLSSELRKIKPTPISNMIVRILNDARDVNKAHCQILKIIGMRSEFCKEY